MLIVRLFHTRIPSCIVRFIVNSPSEFHPPIRSHVHARTPLRSFATSISGGRKHQSFGSQSSPAPELLPLSVPIDEEKLPSYRSADYYPANPGDVLDGRYELKAKVGWGSTSTVWLAQDIGR